MPVKVAMALERFSRHAGGAESYAVELARTMSSRGWEVHLFGHSWDGEPHGAVFHEIQRLPRWAPPSIRILDFAFRHRRMIGRERFDIVLGFGNTLVMNVYQSHGGVHYCSSVRKLRAVSNPLLRWLKAAALFAAPKYHARAWIESAAFRVQPRPVIIAISDMVRQDMAACYGINEQDIHLVYNGIDRSRFGQVDDSLRMELRRELGFAAEEVLFLFMAYDFRKKGVRYLVEAAAALRERVGSGRFGVVVVGREAPYPLSRLVRRLGLEGTVVFPGPTKTPERFYAGCDVFVLPTFYDACSLVVFEAMAAGLPVITTVHNGAAGVIQTGVSGAVLQDARDTRAMAAAMESFLDPDYLRSAAEAARKKSAEYTLENNHSRMIELMERLLSLPGPPGKS